jgi:hypothetical protein
MRAKLMIVSVIALLFTGCAGTQKSIIHTVDENTFFVEVEDFELFNAKVLDLEGASGEKSVVLQDDSSKAKATIKLSKGRFEISVYGLAPSYEEDAFYVTVADNEQQRMWIESPEDILPTLEYVAHTQEADGPCDIVITYIEPNVELDKVEFIRIQ